MAILGQKVYKGTWYFPPEPPRVDNVSTRRTGVGTPGALGRPKAAVIGTGRVEGIPVYGQTKVVTTTYRGERIGSEFELTYPEPTSVATIDVGYLLCRDYFGRGYDIIRIEANDEVVFDAENGAIPKIAFRFYNGLQTTVDPLVRTIVGANAGAHTGDVLLFLPDFPSLTAPTINVVISNAATVTGGNTEIAWTGQTPEVFLNLAAGQQAAYDRQDRLIYQILTDTEVPGLTPVYLAVLDLDTKQERYRVPLQGSEDYVGITSVHTCLAIEGAGYVFVHHDHALLANKDCVYNAATGELVASFFEIDFDASHYQVMPFDDKFVVVGREDFSGTPVMSVIDIVTKTLDVSETGLPLVLNAHCRGRQQPGTVSFFAGSHKQIYELTFDGADWASTLVFTIADQDNVEVLWYDSLTEYLVVQDGDRILLVSPTSGAAVESVDTDEFYQNSDSFLSALDRLWSRPGSVLMFRQSPIGIDVLNINEKTITPLIDNASGLSYADFRTGIFDQSSLAFYFSIGDDVWTEYKIPGTLPGQITLESHITDLLTYLGPYTIDQIEFSGFDGLADWGDVIKNDGTNIRTLLRSYQDPLGFVWTDIGSSIHFRKTPTDGSFVANDTLVGSDLVFKADGSITSVDRSDITRIAKVSLEYISKDDNYQSRTVTADSFSALYEVTRSTREAQYQTSLTLSDLDGERLVNELLWSLQAKDRTHSFSTYAEFVKFIPGDVILVPSGNVSYTVELTKVNIKENLVIEFDARDFQTSLSADVAAVTNTGYSGIVSVSLQSQYIHLDIPLYSYQDDAAGASLVQYGVVASRGQVTWGGGTLYEGKTAGNLSVAYDQATHRGFVGVCTQAFPDMPNAHAGDFTNSLIVRKISGDAPAAATEEQVLLGSNLAFVGKDGRWEGVGFTTVILNDDGSYTISGFAVRGWRGTEVYAGLHQVGDYFVVASPAWVQKIAHPLTDLNVTDFFKAVGFDGSPAAVVAEQHTITGAAEKPYAVINVDDEIDGGDTVVAFDYRSRLSAWEMFSAVPDCGEATLSFEVDVMDADSPNTAIHTYPITTNEWRYTAAQKVTDWGSPPAQANIRIYMMSAAAGRGHVTEATISL
ncbi:MULTISPECIES: phage tail protein [Mesorhizobium]|uniref:GTA baseplate fiber-binding domain-containing protein n=1 Tax=Mesorhizobium TaxID=68287 RepID=UPI0007A95146|nr:MULTISPECIES: phage tail protein [Mesorhizobium]AMX93610.1 hypothetical protein A4R28_11135 [Mesorhizobium ciceri]MDF3208302.1 phage tail protein [Mesorhizobium sp. LMG15046]MDF3229126.1 phage tail protein [Mesorhizobium sp. DSM 30133]RUU22234.1 hypothetical protein EOC84_03745 [Mesorhizobium sp. Primo-B]RUU37857.1 hypothetical protein EOC83_16470 [Mesorhizobium sp. Primo-A]